MRPLIFLALCILLTGCATRPAPNSEPGPDLAARKPRESIIPGTLGRSVRGVPIEHRTLGRGPLTVLLIGLIHGSEAEVYARFDDLCAGLDTPTIRRLATVYAVPCMNPDGYAARRRTNANGVDLNRNWPASNFSPSRGRGPMPLSEPETRAVHRLLGEVSPDLIVVFHSTSNGPFIDPDGPALGEAAAFVTAAASVDPRWRLIPDYTNPPGSLGTYAGLDLGIATLTVEFDRGEDGQLAMEAALSGMTAAIERTTGPWAPAREVAHH